MGFYKNIGNLTFDDIERYIKEEGWRKNTGDNQPMNPGTSSNYWFSIDDGIDGESWSINKVVLRDGGVKYFCEVKKDFWGSHFADRFDITTQIPELLKLALLKEPIYFRIDTELAEKNGYGASSIEYNCKFYTTNISDVSVSDIIVFPTIEHKIKYHSCVGAYERDFRKEQKEQQKLARRFSSRW